MQDIFKNYTEVVEQGLKDILSDYNIGKDDGPYVAYGKTPAAFAKFLENIRNGKKVGPLITYTLSSVNINHNQQMLGFGSLRVESGGYIIQRPPLIATLDYTIEINALTEEEANIFSIELLMKAPFARPYATMRDGQWVTFTIEEPNGKSEVENEDMVFKKTLKLNIQRAYLDYTMKEIKDRIIGDIRLNVVSVEE
jgi:hypothetical protein